VVGAVYDGRISGLENRQVAIASAGVATAAYS
jgi:hypothetical protein